MALWFQKKRRKNNMENESKVFQDIHDIKNSMMVLKGQVSLIHSALIGNELAQDKGLVGRIVEVESAIEKIDQHISKLEKDQQQKSIYVKIIWGAVGVVGGAIVTLILRALISKI
jgi:hypothetical protein